MPGAYGLAVLTEQYESFIKESKTEIIEAYRKIGDVNAKNCIQTYEEHSKKTAKIDMKENFGFYN